MELLKDLRSENCTIYQLNDEGTNNWSALVDPSPKAVGWGNRESFGKAIASDLSLLPNITKQLLTFVAEGYEREHGNMEGFTAWLGDQFPGLLRLNSLQELL